MNILNCCYDDKIWFLTDFVREYITLKKKSVNLLKKFEGVILHVDKINYLNKNNFCQNIKVEWKELKNVYYTLQHSCEAKTCFLLSATRECLKPNLYPSGLSVIDLFDYDIWEKLHCLVGTDLMKLILFDCSLYLPLNNTNSYLALNVQRSSRVLNTLTKGNNILSKNGVGVKNAQSDRKITCVKNNNNREVDSTYGFDGSLLLDLKGIMYNRSAVKSNSSSCFCQYSSCDKIDKLSERLRLWILERINVGVHVEYANTDLSNFTKMLHDFIVKNYAYWNCGKFINSILNMGSDKCQKNILDRNKRKLPFRAYQSPLKKLKISENSALIKELKKPNRRLRTKKNNLKLKSLKPVSLNTVRKFIKDILRNVLPTSAFGNQNEFIIKQMLSVLKYGKCQAFELRDLLLNIKITKIPFLQGINCLKLKWNILAKFLLWFLRTYIFTILADNFYITESREGFNKLLYYKKKDWQTLKYCIINNLINTGRWRVLNKDFVVPNYKPGAIPSCNFRLIPKGKFSARPIMWNRYKSKLMEYCKIYLGQICAFNRKSNKFNNLNEFHNQWLSLCKKRSLNENTPFYFVKVDIFDAYGSIRQKNLMNLFYRFMCNTHIHCYNDPDSGNKKKKIIKKISLRKLKCFKKGGNGLVSCRYLYRFDELPSNIPSNSIIVPTDDVTVIEVEDLYDLIRNEVKFKDVGVGTERCLIVKGIAQGCSLSSQLCLLYYDCLDIAYLKEFSRNKEDLLIRAVDDYLYVTPDLHRAKKFLAVMEEGFSDFYCEINKKKTCTNFGENSSNTITFYGLDINSRTMEVSANYDSYKGVNIFHTMSFKSRINPGLFLKNRMVAIGTLKIYDILLNPLINSKLTILLNIMKASFLMALRFNAIVTNMFKSYNSDFLMSCILIFAKIVTARVKSVERNSNLLGNKAVTDGMVSWTVFKAFYTKLDREKAVIETYESVLDLLKEKLMVIFSKLMQEDQVLLRNLSKYNIENDFKGTH